MKKMLLTLVLGLSTMAVVAQSGNTEITSVKPADENPVVFSSQSELDAKKADKIEKIKVLIRENEGNADKIMYLRKELWRFENAIVVEPKK